MQTFKSKFIFRTCICISVWLILIIWPLHYYALQENLITLENYLLNRLIIIIMCLYNILSYFIYNIFRKLIFPYHGLIEALYYIMNGFDKDFNEEI